ncbi:MAG: protein kinase, partial [Myxococcales bacterium]|nr:protein kinase [Myxococcales bacterium]
MSRRGDSTDEVALGDTIDSDGALGVSDTAAGVSESAIGISETVTPEASGGRGSLPVPSPQAPSDLPEIPRETYAVRRELARGGMGRILVADDARLGRRVAIKELITSNAGLARRFAREVRITARLQHPAIVPVYEAGRWPDGEPFYAMKLIAGRSLEKVVDERPTLDDRLRLVPHLVQLAEAIAYAHGQGVVHRDLKPANVLIGDYGETVVIDWGLAKELDSGPDDEDEPTSAGPADLTVHGSIVGTPAYMAPEQARAEEVDARADVYALGALMFHVLAGRPPYVGKKVDDLLATIRTSTKAPRLLDFVPEVPDELAAIVAHAMAPDPAERYPSAKELAEELSRFQTGQLVAAHRYTRWQLARRWMRRHRAAIASLGALVVGAGVVGAIAVREVVHQRDKARDSNLAALEEQGRRELVAQHPLRAAVYLAEAYRGGRDGEPLRLMLGEAMRAADAAIGIWNGSGAVGFLGWLSRDRLATVADDGAVTLWDVTTNTRTTVAGDRVEPLALAIAESGGALVVVGEGAMRVVDVPRASSHVVKLGPLWPKGVAMSPDGALIAVHGAFGFVLYGRDGTPRPAPRGTASVDEATFTSDRELSVTSAGVTTVYDLTRPETPAPAPAATGDAETAVCGARRFVQTSTAEGPFVTRVDGADAPVVVRAGELAGVECGRDRAIVKLREATSTEHGATPFVAVDADGTARPVGVANERAELAAEAPAQGIGYTATALDPRGRLFAAGTSTGSLRLWDTA